MTMDVKIGKIKAGTILDTGSDRSVVLQYLIEKLRPSSTLLPSEMKQNFTLHQITTYLIDGSLLDKDISKTVKKCFWYVLQLC